MTLLPQITPLIITYDEAPNIGRTLDQLGWAERIVVIDSGSTDGTQEIVARYDRAEVVHRPFDDFAGQCNVGLGLIRTEWVLSLDADYVLSEALVDEMAALRPGADIGGYRAPFVYRIHGRPLRGSLYPPRTVLYRVAGARYRNEGHGHRVSVSGQVLPLRSPIHHDDRKPLARWLASQQRYARVEAAHLLRAAPAGLARIDRLRRLGWPAPLVILPYVLLAKGCLFDGVAGWHYALQRMLAETMLALELIDRRLSDGTPEPAPPPAEAPCSSSD